MCSGEEFTTASECESDDDGILHHRSSHDTSRDEGGVVASTTQLSLQFAINKVHVTNICLLLLHKFVSLDWHSI